MIQKVKRHYIPQRLGTVVVMILFALAGCQDDHQQVSHTREIQFSLDPTALIAGHSGRVQHDKPAAILVTIKDSHGTTIEERKVLDLYALGGDYLSAPLTLEVTADGRFSLTEFYVLGDGNVIRYATPREGSALAHLVDDPLDIGFDVEKDGVTMVRPQVVAVTEDTKPWDFGLTRFAFDVVNTIGVLFSSALVNGSSTPEFTTSHLTIEGLNTEDATTALWTYAVDLKGEINKIILKEASWYRIAVTKPGYKTWLEVRALTDQETVEVLFEASLERRLKSIFVGSNEESGVNYKYNEWGWPTEIASNNDQQGVPFVSHKFHYTASGRLDKAEFFEPEGWTETRTFTYNDQDQLILTTAGSRRVEISYDEHGMPAEMKLKPGYFSNEERARYQYDGEGNLIQIKILSYTESGEKDGWETTENYSYDDQKPITGSAPIDMMVGSSSYLTTYMFGYFPMVSLKHNIVRVAFSTYFDWYGDRVPDETVVSSEFTYEDGLPVKEVIHTDPATVPYYPRDGRVKNFVYE